MRSEAVDDLTQAQRVLEAYFNLPEGEGGGLLPHLDMVHVQGGDWLFHQHDEGAVMYLVVRGRLRVYLEAPELKAIGEVRPFESVGEVSLLTAETRSAGVRAVRDCVLLKVNAEQFERLAVQDPRTAMELARNVAVRLHQNTVGRPVRPSTCRVLTLMMTDRSERLHLVLWRLIDALKAVSRVLVLNAADVVTRHLPGAPEVSGGQPGEAFFHWLTEQEAHYDVLLLVVHEDEPGWRDVAIRQSDEFVALADASTRVREIVPDQKRPVLCLWHPTGEIGSVNEWLKGVEPSFHLHLRRDLKSDLDRAARVLCQQANGLVLGGGAARGFSHLGVYKAMCEAGLPVDWVGGCSIGAILGAAIAKDIGPDGAIEMARDAFVKGRPFGDYTLPVISVLRGRRMTDLTKAHLPGRIEALPINYFAVSANINTGAINVHEEGEIWRATNASAALPGVLPPGLHRGQLAVDGAVLNNLPVDVMLEKPVARTFAVELSSREQGQQDFLLVPSPWRALVRRMIPRESAPTVPGIATIVLKATEVATRAKSRQLGALADLLFVPPVQQFSLLKVEHFDAIVRIGYEHASEEIARWRERSATG